MVSAARRVHFWPLRRLPRLILRLCGPDMKVTIVQLKCATDAAEPAQE